MRQVVLVPRLVLPHVHARVWGDSPQGRQRGWSPAPGEGRLLRYPIVRAPKLGESHVRSVSARAVLAAARERPALVHGHFLHEVGVAAVDLARRLDVPSVVTVHGTDGRWLVDGGIQERHRRRMLEAARAAGRVIVVERGLAGRIVDAGVPAERVVVVPMGVDERLFDVRDRGEARSHLGVGAQDRLVVMVGRATAQKGADVLDEAMRRLDGVRAVLVGPVGFPLERVHVTGGVAPDEVADWLAAADVVCLPSREEASPVSVVEGLASGRPVVATDVGAAAEMVGADGGAVVLPGDAGALADALRATLARDWDPARLRESSRPWWWSEIAPRLAAVYGELL